MLTQDGFTYKFDENRCSTCEGNCCIGESGYIWISKDEIVKLAQFLDKTVDDVISQDLEKIGYKYSIKEIGLLNGGFACKFFDLVKKQCSVYEVRPIQCRTFPFWEHFKENINEVKAECPAIVD